MAYAVFPQVPWLDYEHWDEFPVARIRNDGLGRVRRVALVDLAIRHYRFPETLTTAERQTFETFLRARGYTRDAFLVEDPKDAARTGVALGEGNGSQATFPLPTTVTDEEYRYFPKQGSVVGKVDGSPVSVASVDTDARTITFTAAPGAGTAVTADFTGLRLCVLEEEPHFVGQSVDWVGYAVELAEIVRE